ncbi:MAG: flagellar basal-body rod modification protein FlgD [Clostridiales bacterium]|nr:flagellar basal-body rod modification protein FlgD [Clostridiales bacterium]
MASSLGLVAPIKDGEISDTSKTSTSTKSSNSEMGKDEFLQLLVAQMKYQDPLEPTSNTEYVSQLATFSSLEQMQNLNQSTTNSQAFTLIGKNVIMQTTSSSGTVSYVQGAVDYVTITGNKAYLSIDGSLYAADDLYSVVGDSYMVETNGPSVTEKSLSYDLSNPTDQTVEISLGQDDYAASAVVIYVNGSAIDSDKLSYEDGVVTIDKEAFEDLDAGSYKLGFLFNDSSTTTISDKVVLTVTGIKSDDSSGTA